MKAPRLMGVVAVVGLLVGFVACKESPTEPKERTYSVVTTVQVPAIPTVPLTIATNDPQSQVNITLDVSAQQKLVQLAGGPVTIKMTDMAPSDFGQLPASERALLQQGNASLATLVFDVTRTTASSRAMANISVPDLFDQTSGTSRTVFKVKNSSGKRCTPGVVDFIQIFGTTSTRPASNIIIDDAFPIQNITGEADVAFEVLHFIFCWECPRTTPTGSIG